MSVNKYANLPDIDTAPDVYETEDTFPSAGGNRGDSSDDEGPSRPSLRIKTGANGTDEFDNNSFDVEEATRKFKRAEKRREQHRPRTQYTFPPSPTSPTQHTHTPPISQRLRMLQAELASLEAELADPSNPQLHKEREEDNVDPGELIRELVDVRGRLEKIRTKKEGRGKLVSVVTGEANGHEHHLVNGKDDVEKKEMEGEKKQDAPDVRSIAEMDRRVGELEEIVGSSSTALDETSPLPPPLLPLLTRLNTQLTILAQPRHIDQISRRLKLLLTDLDRVSQSQSQSHREREPARRQSGHAPSSTTPASAPASSAPSGPAPLADQLAPLLARLGPALPHIPHILTRLRTLSHLHASAAEFQGTLDGLEAEQRRTREALEDLSRAVGTVEKSLEENKDVVAKNVKGLEDRVDAVLRRLEQVSK
ncbi:hypothetical protein PUNSTDRAFT_118845 [Punctularia strigosozonata HHB-11173 SS5]|uniref:uncharacterized protein n=1 Tax=Punctularia strigosozonata (strain HHB-11173) TaxID=741275 RepID=UPI0004416C7C|nr:uncharacterized protein PUNSTDRAFT_118845 [Punctularia strigosozonata HHB-11173 SS5]EIN11454.1 hypothetical protein PUNSTDRAFT_118845 [Punctularia strigosozonata HHB-11173 SS5]